MKTIKNLTIILVVLSTLLMGCKSTETKTATEESAYPLDESYPVEEYYYNDYTGDNAAYPVFPIDVTQLTIVPVWTLTGYSVNNQAETFGTKTFTFAADSTYALTTDSGVEKGQWYVTTTTNVFLVLNSEAGQETTYEIVNLTPESMVLNQIQDGTIFEEQYQPAN